MYGPHLPDAPEGNGPEWAPLAFVLALIVGCFLLASSAGAQTADRVCIPRTAYEDAGRCFVEAPALRERLASCDAALGRAEDALGAVSDSLLVLEQRHALTTTLLGTERAACDRARESAEARLRETAAALRRQRVKTLAAVPVTAALVYTACRLVGC